MTPADWDSLNIVETASLLFTNEMSYFDVPTSEWEIDYFAISLNASNSDRSQFAHDIHQVISRLSPSSLSVVLFESQGQYMFSFAERRKEKKSSVFLSDWYLFQELVGSDFISRIDTANFSNRCVKDFFLDFEYTIARSYYIYPISYEYASYEMFPPKLLDVKNYEFLDKETINKIIKENYLLPKRKYQDDYINEEDSEQLIQTLSTDDFALELLELEMDEAESILDNEPFSDDDLESDSNADYDGDEPVNNIDDLDNVIFEDPIVMLKWINNHSLSPRNLKDNNRQQAYRTRNNYRR